jgi:hypothetical protein
MYEPALLHNVHARFAFVLKLALDDVFKASAVDKLVLMLF